MIVVENSDDMMNWIEKFDFEIIERENSLERPEIIKEGNLTEELKLNYDSSTKYDSKFFRRKICSKSYLQDDKINFLRQSIEENNYDYLKYEYSFVSEIFLEENVLALFLYEHFKQEAKDS
jgi:hypothetical protein